MHKRMCQWCTCSIHWHCNTPQHTATHCNTLQHTATHCNILQHATTHWSTVQHTSALLHREQCERLSGFPNWHGSTLNTSQSLQQCATHHNTLQHTATHCNTATHYEDCYCVEICWRLQQCATLQHTKHTIEVCNNVQHIFQQRVRQRFPGSSNCQASFSKNSKKGVATIGSPKLPGLLKEPHTTRAFLQKSPAQPNLSYRAP